MKKVYVLSGVPGSGKSTWANKFKETHPQVLIVSSDGIRYEIGGAYQYFKEEDKVWSLFFSRANKEVEKDGNIDVILDSTCLTNEKRINYLSRIIGFDYKVLVCFDIALGTCLKRNKMHISGKVVKDCEISRMNNIREEPSEEVLRLFDEYIKVTD